MGILVPEEYGGAGADYLSYALAVEELARVDAGTAVTRLGAFDDMFGDLQARKRSSSERWLPQLATRRRDRGLRADRIRCGFGCGGDSRDGANGAATATCSHGRKQWCTSGSYAGVIMGMFRTGGRRRARRQRVSHRAESTGHHRRARDRKAGHSHEQYLRSRLRRRANSARMRCSAKRAPVSAMR